MTLDQEHPGSVASTNAKAALAIRLTIWFSVICTIAFLFCVVTPGKDGLADNILWAYALFLGSFLGINMQQRKNDRGSDYGKLEREMGYPTPDGRLPGAKPEVQREQVRTVTTETATRETVKPPGVPAVADDPEPVQQWADGRAPDAGIL